jgi:5-methylcytosine-specific restriction endonuclease McrA
MTNGGAAVVTELVLHVRGDACTLDDGTPIADSVIERIAPTSFLRALIHDAQRRPIHASSRRRHPTARQKRVVRERDRKCVDCGSTSLLQYDHQPDYERTQHTVVEELRLRCPTCHHNRHAA